MINKIIKRNGSIVDFTQEKITNAVWKALKATGERDRSVAQQLSDKVMAELNSNFSDEKSPSVEQIQDIVENILMSSNQAKAAKGYILYRQHRSELRREKKIILEKTETDEVDKKFEINSLRVLKSRYLRKDENNKLVESPKQLFTRVATHAFIPNIFYHPNIYNKNGGEDVHETAKIDTKENAGKYSIGKYKLNKYHLEALEKIYNDFNKDGKIKVDWNSFLTLLKTGHFNSMENDLDGFYNLMVNKRFFPNTPAIANFGSRLGMGSACFVLGVEDSMEGIMDTLKSAAIIFKSGGGVGYNFSKLRPEGDFVRTTCGVASGPLTFMRMFDVMTDVVKQGGCVSSDTMIRTDKGMFKMGNLLNSKLFGQNYTNHFVYDGQDHNHAILALNNGISEVHDIKTDLGTELRATFNHRVATIDENGKMIWKPVAELKKGDWMINVLGGCVGKKIKLPELEKQHPNSNKIKIPKTLKPELAELLGIYMADGCINRGRFLFSVDAINKDFLKRIKYLMKNNFDLTVGEVRNKETYFDIVFFSRYLEKYFTKVGWKKENSPKAFIPEHIFLSDEKVAYSFLRGLFEGDGSIHPDGYPLLYSSSKRLITGVQELLFSLSIISKITHIPAEKIKGHKGKNDMYKLIVLTDRSIKLFNKNIGFISKLKKNRMKNYFHKKKIEYCDLVPTSSKLFESYYKKVGRGCGKGRSKRGADLKYYRAIRHYIKGDRTLTRKTLKSLIKRFDFLAKDPRIKLLSDEKYFFSRITDINKSRSYTMEIEVPVSGCYVANSFLVHNIRRGANMGMMNIDHPDIEKFIKAKTGNKSLTNFNISILIKPDFWKYYNENKPYPLRSPRDGKVIREVDPRVLFDMIVYQAWESAEPGIIFYDQMNRYNPFLKSLGPIESTNPCGEVVLYPNESCNLGSVNVLAFIKEDDAGKIFFDWDGVADTVKKAVMFLDNIIDVNKFPLNDIEKMSKKTRKVGLGVMGIGDLLYELKIRYDSQEGREFMEKLMEFINFQSKIASIELAKVRGVFPLYDKSFYPEGKLPCSGFYDKDSWKQDWTKIIEEVKKHGLRNGFTTVIAPTGSISMIAGSSSGMEPVYSLVFEKNVKVGSFYYVDPVFEKVMRSLGLHDEQLMRDVCDHGGRVQDIRYIPEKVKKIFITAMDITPENHIKALAAFQKWTDSSISKTTNFPADATMEDMKKCYILAYTLGCKGVTVYRDGSIKGQVLVSPKKTRGTKPKLSIPEKIEKVPEFIPVNGGSDIPALQNKIEDIPHTKTALTNCPKCTTKLATIEGCLTCQDCGWGLCT